MFLFRTLVPLVGLLCLLVSCQVTRHEPISYAPASPPRIFPFAYADTAGNEYLRRLRTDHDLEALIAGVDSDRERALVVLDWTRKRWNGHGKKAHTDQNALNILEESGKGRKFRCVEYSTVLTAALASVGMPARRVGLKKKSVETALYGAGHMVAEVWLADENKWALLDGQYNLLPIADGKPLNAIEFKRALQEEQRVDFLSYQQVVGPLKRRNYLGFIERYLYFVNVRFDERMLPEPYERLAYGGKTQLMLVPLGVPEPTKFQRKQVMDRFVYTRSVADMYGSPYLVTRLTK